MMILLNNKRSKSNSLPLTSKGKYFFCLFFIRLFCNEHDSSPDNDLTNTGPAGGRDLGLILKRYSANCDSCVNDNNDGMMRQYLLHLSYLTFNVLIKVKHAWCKLNLIQDPRSTQV